MRKIIIILPLLFLTACANPELDKTKDEIAQLKLEYEKLTEVYNEMVETRIPLSEKIVDLDKVIEVEFDVLDKAILSFYDGNSEIITPVAFGLHDIDHDSPVPLILSDKLYNDIEIGKRYRFKVNAVVFYESETQTFKYQFTSERAEEVFFGEK